MTYIKTLKYYLKEIFLFFKNLNVTINFYLVILFQILRKGSLKIDFK